MVGFHYYWGLSIYSFISDVANIFLLYLLVSVWRCVFIAAVLFEQQKYEDCIELCKKAVDVGREQRAEYTLIAKFVV